MQVVRFHSSILATLFGRSKKVTTAGVVLGFLRPQDTTEGLADKLETVTSKKVEGQNTEKPLMEQRCVQA